ncbi:SH3 domain-containing kinase-binding protein 1-like isoform X1 [Sinocyclocheilus rhinocerous]|uniref:SH3 domain-containing kinase-binding protein 1-like isoform X1 n=1 Tax=Sinocyclocheilus rhinocerous TaxID=307959 RepID=UPI0007BA0675|nr:PREDICTED: SH3 domain-containing kinase-binding protein 1-like isoform X1 [Sinocyclocheilus rhinocerous]
MEVLVLLDFEATMPDELTICAGDVVKNVSKGKEEGWLEGELRGKRGMFPCNFVKEVPVYLIGESNREPRSMRKSKKTKVTLQARKCEVAFPYTPANEDELDLVVGETIEILREIEDGWWIGKKNNRVGAFPSNFVKEIFVPSKDGKTTEATARPKLSEVFSKEGKVQQRPSLRRKTPSGENSKNMPYHTDDVSEGELNGRRGFFPDNFVMVIPADALHTGNAGQPPVRHGSQKNAVNQMPVMDQNSSDTNPKTETKSEKPDTKDFRSDPPGKIKLPGLHKPPVPPPPVKGKPIKLVPKNEEPQLVSPKQPPASPVQKEVKDSKEVKEKTPDQFDSVDVSSEKLSHPTGNRVKPPQRRPPTALTSAGQVLAEIDNNETSEEKDGLPQNIPEATEPQSSPSTKTDQVAKTTSPPKTPTESKAVAQEESASLASVLTELKDLRMSLDLLKAQHERDIKELKDELKDEMEKRMRLQVSGEI